MLELSRSTLSFCRHWMMNSNVGLRIEMPYYVKLTSDDTTSLTPHLIVSKSLSDITGEVVSTVIHLNSVVVCYGSAVIPTDSQVNSPTMLSRSPITVEFHRRCFTYSATMTGITCLDLHIHKKLSYR